MRCWSLPAPSLGPRLRAFAVRLPYRLSRERDRQVTGASTRSPVERPCRSAHDRLLGQQQYRTRVHNVLAEWRANNAGTMGMPSSRREVLRFAAWDGAHNPDTPMFNPHARPGDTDYGLLYIGTGDGGNRQSTPIPTILPRTGKWRSARILRINPLARGSSPYSVASDNPFVGQPDMLPEIWATGPCVIPEPLLRSSRTRRSPGHGYWPSQHRGGELGRERSELRLAPARGHLCCRPRRSNPLYQLPANDGSYGFTYPVVQYDHSEGRAIIGGYVARGSAVPALAGHYLFGDLLNGRVFHRFPSPTWCSVSRLHSKSCGWSRTATRSRCSGWLAGPIAGSTCASVRTRRATSTS